MGIFGWSYPAGVSRTPYDDFPPENCPVCGKDNADEYGDWAHKDGPFCSEKCEREYESEKD